MHAVGAHAKKRHGAAVEAEHRRIAPARHHIEGLVAPFGDAVFDDERLDHLVDRGADRVGVALGNQTHHLRLPGEHTRETAEQRGVVVPQPADATLARDERNDPRRVAIVAGADVIGERHRLLGSVERAPVARQHGFDADDLPHTARHVVGEFTAETVKLHVDREHRSDYRAVPLTRDKAPFGEQLDNARHNARFRAGMEAKRDRKRSLGGVNDARGNRR
jgi:hypothetical protein